MKTIFIPLCCLLFLSLTLGAKTKKAVFIIIDGVPADQVERLQPPALFDIASEGAYGRAYTGGEIGGYSETPTISAIGYTNLLTATWMNKHNVSGNDHLNPNYHYWTIFRIAKAQPRPYATALYSSWTDNRTVLLGEGKPETGSLQIDYIYDGYELDTIGYPAESGDRHIFRIDETVSEKAAHCIREKAPDLNWVYLWYTDDAGHLAGNGAYFDEYVLKADRQIAKVWEAVKEREARFDEEWMVVVTTDHGRTEDGYGHGGQSVRERTTWISTNQPVNRHFREGPLAITDIAPSLCRFMGFELPRAQTWEQDGIPFIGPVAISDLQTLPYDDTVCLSWRSYEADEPVTVHVAPSNRFKEGGKDEWICLDTVAAGKESYCVDLSKLPASRFYKFVVATPHNHLNRWLIRK